MAKTLARSLQFLFGTPILSQILPMTATISEVPPPMRLPVVVNIAHLVSSGGSLLARPIALLRIYVLQRRLQAWLIRNDQTKLANSWEASSLLTVFPVQKNRTIDAKTLSQWRTHHLNRDDCFHVENLEIVVFSGVQPTEIHMIEDAQAVFKEWNSKIRYEPDLQLMNGPYYAEKEYCTKCGKCTRIDNLRLYSPFGAQVKSETMA
jgi:hypothetical protein